MARPRSEDKRNAIIASATDMFAEQGVGASTFAIAKGAGVAEGTLFKYFSSKDELINVAYLTLKDEMQRAMLSSDSSSAAPRERTQHFWKNYVEWGAANPVKRRAMSQLMMSDKLTPENRAAGSLPFAGFTAMLTASMTAGLMRQQPEAFVFALLRTMAETTMDFMANDPTAAAGYRDAGFEAFWRAIAS